METKIVFEGRCNSIEHTDICARTEELFACTSQQDYMHIFVETRLQNSLIELVHHLITICISRQVR